MADQDSLAELLTSAKAASLATRIEYRDRIAAFGRRAIPGMSSWLEHPTLGAFAVQVLRMIGANGARKEAVAALRQARPLVSDAVRRDIDFALSLLEPRRDAASRATSAGTGAKGGTPGQPRRSGVRERWAAPAVGRDIPTGSAEADVRGTPVLVKWFESETPGLRASITRSGEKIESLEWFVLSCLSRDLQRLGRIDNLIGIESLRGTLIPHAFQMAAALRVLRDGNRSMLLADEVGLGKTIEAGLVIKELLLRGEVKSVLIVVPRALVTQWQRELRDKFGEEFTTTDDDRGVHLVGDRVITTLGKFQRSSEEFVERDWDLVLFDEAHLLANPKSKRRAAAGELPRRWLLLLTATPLSNKITDLWSLVDLVSPGRLGSQFQFVATYAADKTLRRVWPERTEELRLIAREVMTRTRRAESGVPFTARHVETRRIRATKDEDDLYDAVTDYLVRSYRPRLDDPRVTNRGMLIREAISLQQSLSSGPHALATSLEHRSATHPQDATALKALAERARSIRGSKERLLLKIVGEIPEEPAVIFTLRKRTLERLTELLEDGGNEVRPYHGEMGVTARRDAIDAFTKGSARFLVATDAGAEGLNLHQRCNIVFNYDLHWNPMKLEQRIGRVHRFGQERPVSVFNLAVADTVDDYVLEVLTQKLNLFTLVIGEVEDVLAEIEEGEGDLETMIMEIILRAGDRADLRRRMKELEENLGDAYRRSQLAREFTAGVLG